MRILAIETSCDETAIAIVDFFGSKQKPRMAVLSNIISSQVKLHAKFGGVVPNLAKREHQKNLVPIIIRALKESQLLESGAENRESNKKISGSILEREPELLKKFRKYILPLKSPKIDAIAITHGPGLAPALWVGVNFARALATLWRVPLIPVNHMAGHAYSPWLYTTNGAWRMVQNMKFPALALLVSGGHTELVLIKNYGKYKILGQTLDDAAGEAFDKVARLLGLGYPGGPEIASEAAKYKKLKSLKVTLPRPMLNTKDYNFSFSGLKTAVLYLVRDLKEKYSLTKIRPAIAREFQDAVVEVLATKTIRAAKEYKVKTVLLGGGVAANKKLRHDLGWSIKKELPRVSYFMSRVSLTGDNALMIALAAYFAGKKKAPTKVGADANAKLSS